MLNGVLRSPMLFFDSNPAGRVINRFGADIGTVEASLPKSSQSLFTLLATVSCSTFPPLVEYFFEFVLSSCFPLPSPRAPH